MSGGRRFQARELRIGGESKDALLRRLAEHSVLLNRYARDLFADDAFETSAEARTVRVSFVSLPEIGMPDGARFKEILGRAADVGLRPCPLEVAPHLRLDYLDQPEGPYLTVASPEPRPGASTPSGFYLRRREDGLWLRGYVAGPEHVYTPKFTEFVFLNAGS